SASYDSISSSVTLSMYASPSTSDGFFNNSFLFNDSFKIILNAGSSLPIFTLSSDFLLSLKTISKLLSKFSIEFCLTNRLTTVFSNNTSNSPCLNFFFTLYNLLTFSYNPNEETSKINVNCQIKDTVSLNEPINLNASLTYDDQPREEAEIIFEVWESGNKNNSKMLQAENLGDGNYTHDYTFEKAGIYEIAAHSNIKEIDPLPQKEIVVT